ncbi:comF family protein [Bryocella elongata]|uniref:ComF family protein n=1 Tax=Bryocella elongata TaxID=863522 RepID=A0A1H5STZ9_9BACT|nr:ComF family protein [Bryocella elongata]SEF53934.1 comF family protein [Bryocella elongata]
MTRVLRSCTTHLQAATRTAVADLATTLVPSDCHLCGCPLTTLRPAPVCERCILGIEALPPGAPLCASCGDLIAPESVRMAGGWGDGRCSACRISPPAFARAVAFAPYSGSNRDLLHMLKFDGMEPIAREVLGQGMAQAILQLQPEAAKELVVVPVPLFRARQRRRGFNQAERLAEAGLEVLGKSQPSWQLTLNARALERVRDTHELYPLTPHQRKVGLRGAFRVTDAAVIRGREVLLVDDILTTGATASECTRVLLRAGATRVWVATWARTVDPDAQPGVAFWNASSTRASRPSHGRSSHGCASEPS